MKAIEFENVSRAYRRGVNVLDGISFNVESGEVVGLLGRNGVGKTTLIRIAMGMLEAQQGMVRVLGMDPRRNAVEVKRRVGYVSEEQILPPGMKLGDVVRFHHTLFPDWDEALERQLVERFRLSPSQRIKALSKGQARQVALLCAVAHRPEVLILDEPAGGLDPAARREFLETSIQLLNESGTTILFSSHYMTDVERMAGRIILLDDGHILIDQQLDSLREDYSLALVPAGAADVRNRLRALNGCLCVRARGDSWHAIFQLDPARCRTMLEHELGIHGARCTSIALEDMFVELAGGRS